VLRTALSLAAIQGRPLHIHHIRGGRRKPGLLRQHLACVRVVQAICGGQLEGDTLGSDALHWSPGPIRAGSYAVAVGSAGSAHLVLQTALPVLLQGEGPSTLVVEGGTHNPKAPTAEHIAQVVLPAWSRMGASVDYTLEAVGFVPAGGGRLRVSVQPASWQPLHLEDPKGPLRWEVGACWSQLPDRVVVRVREELEALSLGGPGQPCLREVQSVGPGLAMQLIARFDGGAAGFAAFGAREVSTRRLVRSLAKRARRWAHAGVGVDEHTADQLLLPMALAGGGSFRTGVPSLHAQTQADVIAAFGAGEVSFTEQAPGRYLVEVRGAA